MTGLVFWTLVMISTWLGLFFGNASTLLGPFLMFILVPIADYFEGIESGRQTSKMRESLDHPCTRIGIFLIYLGFLGYAVENFTTADFGFLGTAGAVLSLSILSGFFVFPIAHEIMHSRGSQDRLMAMLLLTPIGYAHFVIAHLDVHHFYATTGRDPSTARYRESVYRFLLRSIPLSFQRSWRSETYRVRKKAQSTYSLRHGIVFGIVLTSVQFLAVALYYGPSGLGFLLTHGILSILWIETLNYVQHYGLEREDKTSTRRMELFSYRHAWDSRSRLSNQILFYQGQHNAHHRDPEKPYSTLPPSKKALVLPYGYITMMLIALVPPIWFFVMNPLVQRARRGLPLDLKRDPASNDKKPDASAF